VARSFVSTDPLRWSGAEDTLLGTNSLQPFVYTNGDPINLIDPSGLGPWDTFVGSLVGFGEGSLRPLEGYSRSNADFTRGRRFGRVVGAVTSVVVGGQMAISGGMAMASGAASGNPKGAAASVAVSGQTVLGAAMALNGVYNLTVIYRGRGDSNKSGAQHRQRQVFKDYPTRKKAIDARSRPKPHKPKAKRTADTDHATTRQQRNKLGTGSQGEQHRDGTRHVHDDNHGRVKKDGTKTPDNVHYGYPD
jgi:hypothetical protein